MKRIDYFYLWIHNSAILDFKDKTNSIMLGICLLYYVHFIPYFLLQTLAWIILFSLCRIYFTMGETLYQLKFKEEIIGLNKSLGEKK